jgi:CRISPR-associated protein Csc2
MTWLSTVKRFGLSDYLLDEIPLLKSAKTIQVFVLRQTHDYTIFRTEETRELNTVTLPKSISESEPAVKVVFLASKQKAPENRNYITLFRSFASNLRAELEDERLQDKINNCTLKDNLCRRCPRCVLFGAVSTEKKGGSRWNIKHRIEYSSAYSIETYEDISEMMTFNAVDVRTQSTGQALGYTENIEPIAHFPSVITLNSITEEELIWYLKILLATKSYGAESRVKGDVTNEIIGIAAGYEEIMTSLEFSLELADNGLTDPMNTTYKMLQKYASIAAFPDRIRILNAKELTQFLNEIRNFNVTKKFIEALRDKSKKFAEQIENAASP